mgnify:CR=1 FL=1
MRTLRGAALAVAFLGFFATHAHAQSDPLPSSNDGAAKMAIIDFVQTTTTQGSPHFVHPAGRIATCDQDGTLWVEHQTYSQFMHVLGRALAVVKAKSELATIEPFKAMMSGKRGAIAKLSQADVLKIVAATLTGMSVDEFNAAAKKWLAEARDRRCKKHHGELTYLPMQEVLTPHRADARRPTAVQ